MLFSAKHSAAKFLLPRREFFRRTLPSTHSSGGILHGGQIIALAAKRVNENSEDRPISYFSRRMHMLARSCQSFPSFRLVQDLRHLAPPAKEIIGGADRCNQDRAQAVDQGKDQSLLPRQLAVSSSSDVIWALFRRSRHAVL